MPIAYVKSAEISGTSTSWEDQQALDLHHASPMMKEIAELREKYDLHMKAERYISDENGLPERDSGFLRK